ncbi:MAG TPA: hypothetical protein VIC33_13780 [Vicinamibacterales bacterium]|jgi:hypothetical protein
MAADLRDAVSRWLAAEHDTDEAGAEHALSLVFGALPSTAAPPGLATRIVRTAQGVTLATGRRPLRSTRRRAVRIGSVVAGIGVAAYVAVRLLLPLIVSGFVRGIGLLLHAVLWMSVGFSTGLDIWTMLARAGRWAGAALTTPQVAITLVLVEVIGGLALYVVQRMLASEKESSRP